MAQQTTGDFDIVPGSTPGETLAAILNRNNAANITMHSGSTAPTYLLNGMLWLDTTSSSEHIAKYYNSGDTSWIELFRVTTATGLIVFSAETPATTAYHLTNKTYVDGADDLKLNLTGGTVSGQIKGITPVAISDLTRKDYVDAIITGTDIIGETQLDVDALQNAGLIVTAWCVFNGTTLGSNEPTAGENIASVDRVSAGRYTITFTTAMDNINYSVAGLGRNNTAGTFSLTLSPFKSSSSVKEDPLVGSFKLLTGVQGASADIDGDWIMVLIFGGKA